MEWNGERGFLDNVYQLGQRCQNGVWNFSAGIVRYGGSFLVGTGYYGPCASANIKTGACLCPAGYTARLIGMGGWWSNAPWDSFLTGYSCER